MHSSQPQPLGAPITGTIVPQHHQSWDCETGRISDDELTEIIATAYQSDQLRNLGAEEVLDELRVLIRDKCGITAFFCFSTQIKGLNQLRIYGPANSMTADIITGSLIRKGTARIRAISPILFHR